MKELVTRFKLLTAAEAACAALLSFCLGSWLSDELGAGSALIGGLWAVISAVVIEHVKYKEMLRNAQVRILGTLVGCFVSWLGFSAMGYYYWSFFICMFVSVMICAIFKLSVYRLCCVTIAVIFTVSLVSGGVSPWINASSRFLESLIGVAVTLLLALIASFIRDHYNLKETA